MRNMQDMAVNYGYRKLMEGINHGYCRNRMVCSVDYSRNGYIFTDDFGDHKGIYGEKIEIGINKFIVPMFINANTGTFLF